jgi:fimbrial chaperone protein
VAGGASPAAASTFTVAPIQIFLGASARSALLSLQNTSGDAIRFKLNVYAWQQSVAGEIQLAPTSDIVFFPPLVNVPAGEERKIRVGVTAAAGTVEKTYRIFVEELPALVRPGASGATQVRLLTRVGVPIFVQPSRVAVGGRIEAAVIRGGRLTFDLVNTGTVHLLPQSTRVMGHDATGAAILDRPLSGWYVLAGGRRAFELTLSPIDCARLRSLTMEIRAAQATFSERLETTPEACTP